MCVCLCNLCHKTSVVCVCVCVYATYAIRPFYGVCVCVFVNLCHKTILWCVCVCVYATYAIRPFYGVCVCVCSKQWPC